MFKHGRFWTLLVAVLLAGCVASTPRVVVQTVLVTQPPPPTYTPYPTYTMPAQRRQATATMTATPAKTATPVRTATPTASPTPAFDAVVNVETLNVRAGPDTAYDRVGQLRRGDGLTATARTEAGDWLAVVVPGGTKGWVFTAYVDLSISLDGVPLAVDLPPTPTPSGPTPTPLPPVDAELDRIARGKHGELAQPREVGHVGAGGEAEVEIVNDTPYELTILVGSPSSVSVTIEACSACKVYSMVGPIFCPEEGRPRKSVRLKPGTSSVAARVTDPSVVPFLGTWELKADTRYFNCFYIVTRFG